MNQTVPSWLRVASWIAVCGWSDVVVFLSSLSGSEVEKALPLQVWDKLLHFTAFFVGAVVLASALRWTADWSWPRLAALALGLLAAFSALDELHQLLTPGRSGADVLDWLSDVLGSAAGLTVTAFFYARSARKSSLAPAGA